MQSLRSTDSQTHIAAATQPTQSARQRRRILVAALMLTGIGISWYYSAYVYSRPITRYDQLEIHVGKRVAFTTIVDRQYKAYELVYLDGKAIRFSHTLGGIDWSPEPGEVCRVVGQIEYEPNNLWGIPYRLSHGEYFALGANP